MRIITTLIALAAAVAVAAPSHEIKRRDLVDDDAPHQDDANFISAVMRAHWYWRRLHCAQDLVWDAKLADAARKDIEECTHEPEHVSSSRALGDSNRCGDDLMLISARNAPAATYLRSHPRHLTTMPGSSSPALPPTAGTRRRPSIPTTTLTSMPPGATSRRWSGVTRALSAALSDTAMAMSSSGPVASTAVSDAQSARQVSTDIALDYEFFGNNVAAGQFEAQVWGPVCNDPSVKEVAARESVDFNWAVSK